MSTVNKHDLNDISAELTGISAMISGFSFQFEPGMTCLNANHIQEALWSVSAHLDRVAEELEEME